MLLLAGTYEVKPLAAADGGGDSGSGSGSGGVRIEYHLQDPKRAAVPGAGALRLLWAAGAAPDRLAMLQALATAFQSPATAKALSSASAKPSASASASAAASATASTASTASADTHTNTHLALVCVQSKQLFYPIAAPSPTLLQAVPSAWIEAAPQATLSAAEGAAAALHSQKPQSLQPHPSKKPPTSNS